MEAKWPEFIDKVTNWADRESNDYSFRFSVFFNNDYLILTSSKNDVTHKIRYTKEKYFKDKTSHTDKDILPLLFQILKDQYRDGRWSVVSTRRGKKQ